MKLFELEASLALNTSGFSQDIGKARSEMLSLSETTRQETSSIMHMLEDTFSFSAGQLLADGIRDGLRSLSDFAADSIMAASDLEEVRNVIDVTFGDDAASIYAWAENAKNAFGMSTLAALDYAGQMGSVLKVQDFAADDVRDMSKAIVELAADYASFKNIDFADAFGMLRSGLRGETESIERLGLTVHVSTMMDYLGLEKETDFTKGMTQAEQIMARYNYIMDKSAFVQGDFARTSDSFANQMRILNTNIDQLQASLGEDFLPVATGFLQFMNFFFEDTQTANEAVDGLRQTFSETYASIETTTADALALVNALKELEKTGVDDPEDSAWSQLVNQLLTDIPALGEKIPSATAALEAGADAIESYIQEWRNLQLETGRSSFLSEYYNILGEKQAAYAKEQTEYETFALEAEARKALFSQTWTNALNYLYEAYGEEPLTADEISNIIGTESGIKTALQSLNALANRGDAGAATFRDVLSELATPDELSRQLAIERNEMDSAYLEMTAVGNKLDAILDALSSLNTDISSAVSEGIGNISVTVSTAPVTLSTGALLGQLTPRLDLELAKRYRKR